MNRFQTQSGSCSQLHLCLCLIIPSFVPLFCLFRVPGVPEALFLPVRVLG